MRFLLLALSIAVSAVAGADLKVGDTLPDCEKIPILDLSADYKPQPTTVASLERHLLSDGVVILHFCSPRPPKGGGDIALVPELSALQKAASGVSYRCNAVGVVPFGSKGRADAATVIDASPEKPWGGVTLYYEPTFPRPGLYRTFRPGTDGEGGPEIATPYTYLIGPGRKILAVREPGSQEPLYQWLQKNLPDKVTPVAKNPTSQLSLPDDSAWTWPTFRRSLAHAPVASSLPDYLPYIYLAWQAGIGRTFASPAVADNVVYLNTNDRGLFSLSLPTGQAVLTYPTGETWWSSPVVAGGFVYAASTSGAISCLDRGTFKRAWKVDLGGLVTSSPVVSGGTLYVGSRNGAVYALDAATGTTLWVFQTGGEISSSPALSGGSLLIGSGDRNIYAVDAKTGVLKWSATTNGPVDSSPAVAGGDVVIGSFDGSIYSFKLADGSLNWRCELGGWVHSSPAIADDTVFIGTVNVPKDLTPSFNWIDLKTGKRKGYFDMPDAVYSSPTVWGDLVLVGCRDHQLYAFDRKMRQTQPAWTYRTRSYVHASPTVVGDTVLVASFDGSLYALRQAKPIKAWNENDVVPRWFVAALCKELHREVADLVAKAAAGKAGTELRLRSFDKVFADIRGGAKGAPPKVLPRDVPPEHPGASYIEYVLTSGLLAGYPDSTFGPNEPTTRYQFSFGLNTAIQVVRRPDFAWKAMGDKGAKSAQVEVQVKPAPGRARNMPRDVAANHWAFKALGDLAADALVPMDEEGMYRGNKILTLKDAEAHWNLYAEALRIVRVK